MYQGTTPTVIFKVKGYDLTDASVYVSFKYGNDVLTKNEVGVSYASDEQISYVSCGLTQEETLAMKRGGVVVQIRFIYENGQAYATNKAVLEMNDVIYRNVIEFGGDGE